MQSVALIPKHIVTFIFREYIAPLTNSQRFFILGSICVSLTSAIGVQSHLAHVYSAMAGWFSALAIEIIYVGGALAGSSPRHTSKIHGVVIWSSLMLAALLAIIFNFAFQLEQRGYQEGFFLFVLIAEATGFPLLAVLTAYASHAIGKSKQAEEDAEKDRERKYQEKRRSENDALVDEWRRKQMSIELGAKKKALQIQNGHEGGHATGMSGRESGHAHGRKTGINGQVGNDAHGQCHTDEVNEGGQRRDENGHEGGQTSGQDIQRNGHAHGRDREELKRVVKEMMGKNEPINKTKLAQDHGVSRRTMGRIIDEIEKKR